MSEKKAGKNGKGGRGGGGEDVILPNRGSGDATNNTVSESPDPFADAKLRCKSLLNLEVKVLSQALGAENQWTERGDGRVEFVDFTIRVTADKAAARDASAPADGQAKDDSGTDSKSGTPKPDHADDDAGTGVILEDTITSETPFVGENCCIVWNSFDQGLSLCLMYASEEGYSASWSALVALQDKTYPPLSVDLLRLCLPPAERPSSASSSRDNGDSDNNNDGGEKQEKHRSSDDPAGGGKSEPPMVPYSFYIHNQYDPPLGFIENHALSLNILEHGHVSRVALYEDRDTVLTMLNLANADLLEHLLTKDVYSLLADGLGCPMKTANSSSDGECAEILEVGDDSVIPPNLSKLTIPEDVADIVAKDRRLTHLQQVVLQPMDDFTDLLLKLSAISHRLRNALTCSLLSSDATLREARDALMISPPVTANAASAMRHRQALDSSTLGVSVSSGSRTGSLVGNTNELGSSFPSSGGGGGTTSAAGESCVKAERQVLAHLRFFRSLASLSIAELGKELVGPVVVKIFQSGLLEALSVVAERFAMPSDAAQSFLSAIQDSSGNSSPGGGGGVNRRAGSVCTTNAATWYTPAIEAELVMLLDVTLVRLNERQEEQLMNELVRTPVLSEPPKYNGIVTFMVRQLALGNAGTSALLSSLPLSAGRTPVPVPRGGVSSYASRCRVLHDSMSTRNPFILYHILGLHDDEGSAAAERALDPESTDIRNRFHNFIITKYFFQASRGTMVPVPPPPAVGASVTKSAPIIQFGNSGGTQNLLQGISPAFLRVLEYLINLSTTENREALLRVVFHHKSHIMGYIESCCEVAAANHRSVGLDVLAGCMRFLRTIIGQVAVREGEAADNPMVLFTLPPEPPSKALVTTICRQLTVERDTFGIILKAYHKIGGTRRNTVFHSAVLSLLELIDHHVPTIKDGSGSGSDDVVQGNNDLRDVRDYLFLKHLRLLPSRFERKFRESLLSEVSSRLGRESYTPNDSVSVLSSTASEMLRSSSKLRFVDEVEAATGGVDGTVVPESVSNLSPVVVGNVHSSEEKLSKKLRTTMELLSGSSGSGSGGHLRGSNSGSPIPNGKSGSPPGTSPGAAHNSPNGGGGGGHSPVPFRASSPNTPPVAGASSVASSTGGLPQFSPPATVHITRPGSGNRPQEPQRYIAPVTSLGDGNGRRTPSPESSVAPLKPVVPSYEKPAVRPRSGRASSELLVDAEGAFSVDSLPRSNSSNGGAVRVGSLVPSPSGSPPLQPMSSVAPSNSAGAASQVGSTPANASSSSGGSGSNGKHGGSPGAGETVVLPKIRKRTTAVNSKR